MIASLTAAFLASVAAPVSASTPVPEKAPQIYCDGQERNLQTYLKMTDILFNGLQADRASEFYADEFISHGDDRGGIGARTYRPENLTNMWKHINKVEKNRKLTNNLIVCKGDLVIAEVTLGATYVGADMEGNPPEGRRYQQSGIDIYRFKDDKVIERWGNSEGIAKIRQLGLKTDLSLRPLE